ncbi:hypothetical protein NQ095_07885 [Rossellomorea sp. SC111]|uniref:hypothetical protein n=1 Tax=Rossellomorea sp. SC111 TaxID=2968985 RepID=UPI00215A8C6D|nr:hypothetical protein [Rossellomorea sp. SC111]MCR8848319.1 hypothetical protein [Rossellomorea sp. SC111]
MKYLSIILLSVFCLLLGGCRVIFFEESVENPNTKYKLDAKVYIKRANIIIRNKTNLPPKTELAISIQPYSENQLLGKIQAYKVEPQNEKVNNTTVIVDEKGKVEPVVIDRPDPSKRYRIEVSVKNEDTTEDNNKISLAKYINLMKIEDPDGIGANLTFLSMAEIKELFQTPMQAKKNG